VDECAVSSMRKRLELGSDGGDSGNKKCIDAMVRSGEVCVWREHGVRRLVLCWGVWHESGISRREYVFKFYLLCFEIL
jgi:hypothetical protein